MSQDFVTTGFPFTAISRLGRGTSGEVWECTHPLHGRIAVKVLRTSPGAAARRQLSRQLRQPTALLDTALDTQKGSLYQLLTTPKPGRRNNQVFIASTETGVTIKDGIRLSTIVKNNTTKVYQIAPCCAVAVNINVGAVGSDDGELVGEG